MSHFVCAACSHPCCWGFVPRLHPIHMHNSRTCVKHTHFPFQHPIFHLRLFPFDFLFSPTDLDSISSNHLSLRLRMQLQLHPRSTITVYRLPLFGEVNIEKYSNVFVLNFLRNPIYNERLIKYNARFIKKKEISVFQAISIFK